MAFMWECEEREMVSRNGMGSVLRLVLIWQLVV
jgi:hypothetical protein